MIWLTWRQFRVQAAAVAAVAVACRAGPGRHRPAARRPRHDRTATSSTSSPANDRHLFYAGIVVLAVAPAIIGVFWGAPLVARELEAGTHRLAWTQSVTRTRWLATSSA